MLKLTIAIIYCLLAASATCFAAAEKAGSNQPTYLISGDAQLLSHFIDRGLSMSDQNPALNASFLFNLGQQFRVGFWGSNISNVTSADDNLWLKIVADVRVDISSTSRLVFYIHDDHFYKSNLRNGQEVGINLDYVGYLFQAEYFNNFQGTKTNGEYLKFGKKFPMAHNFNLIPTVGYTLQHANTLSNYFDFKMVAEYPINQFMGFELGGTTTSGANALNGRGGTYIYVAVKLAY
ncbi:MAG: hypothetical protein H7235_01975 [Bdellovibrionaceae bacterium]|nr:hypothetical protein [Pseudobdellovibrionaceae bacterium]MBC7457018.1 hypothetical protein [Pseudobdellovibrionaceae bacterium]